MKTLTAEQIAKRWTMIYPINGVRSQGFGENRALNDQGVSIYKEMGMDGHNGIDLAAPLGTNVYFPCEMTISQMWDDDRGSGYGRHIRCTTQVFSFMEGLWSGEFYLEILLGHFSAVEPTLKVGDRVTTKQLAGKCGCTGICSGPHVHLEIRPYYKSIINYVEMWQRDLANGFKGAINPEPLLRYEPLNVERLYEQFDGRLIKSTDSPKVYLLKDGQKKWFPNEEILWSHGYILWGTGDKEILKISPAEINLIPDGDPIQQGPYWEHNQRMKAEYINYLKIS